VTHVIVVDKDDTVLGTEEKLRAHTLGTLHRAVSVFVLNAAGQIILQRRAAQKYHSGGLWSNTACTHPRPNESPIAAARRCLQEEMGLDAALRPAFRFIYRADVPPGLIEHEYDHVFVGAVDAEPQPSAAEVLAWRAVAPNVAAAAVAEQPQTFTAWFRLALPLYQRWIAEKATMPANPLLETPTFRS
jgi:isopentenyl-diphosphate delta-isomerase